DDYLVGMPQTYSWDQEESITDSAAAATTMASGVKTYNNAIAVDLNSQEVDTVLAKAQKQGKSTGLAATSQVNHATHASLGDHNDPLNNYNEIADDFRDDQIDGEPKVDVILGGGTSYFERKDRNLAEEFEKTGFSYVQTTEELLNDDNEQVLGLFAPV